jgi:hypothetical protein
MCVQLDDGSLVGICFYMYIFFIPAFFAEDATLI